MVTGVTALVVGEFDATSLNVIVTLIIATICGTVSVHVANVFLASRASDVVEVSQLGGFIRRFSHDHTILNC